MNKIHLFSFQWWYEEHSTFMEIISVTLSESIQRLSLLNELLRDMSICCEIDMNSMRVCAMLCIHMWKGIRDIPLSANNCMNNEALLYYVENYSMHILLLTMFNEMKIVSMNIKFSYFNFSFGRRWRKQL